MSRFTDALLDWFTDRATRQEDSYLKTSFDARVASSLPGAYFQATIHLTWPPRRYNITPRLRAQAEQQLRETLEKVTREYSVLHLGETETAANLALNNNLYLSNADIHLVTADTTITAEAAGVELTEQHEALRREAELANTAQQAQLERLRVLGNHVLADPALARLWWLDGKPERLPEMVKMGDLFERAATLITAQPQSPHTEPIADLIHVFLRDLGPQHRALMVNQLQQIFLGYEREDLAYQINLVGQPPNDVNGQRPYSENS